MTKLVFSVLASTALLFGCQADAEVKPGAEAAEESVVTAKASTEMTDAEPNESSATQTADVAVADTTDMEVAVFRDGGVEIGGEKLELEAAIATIQSASGSDTMVYYYRESPQEEPHPNAMTMIKTIMEAGLGLAFSSEPDFSTIVAPDTGEISPRN